MKGLSFITASLFDIKLLVKWSGVDETVVERFAAKAGREPWEPFINTDTGDLLLFVFLVAGIAGGFMLGYYYRKLFREKPGVGD